jgi:hypothetical protein
MAASNPGGLAAAEIDRVNISCKAAVFAASNPAA